MKTFIHPNDPYQMNWVEGNTDWGTVKCPEGITVHTQSIPQGETLTERFTFTNITDREIFTSLQDIAIYTTFNDDYQDSKTCITNKCHTHIWCGGNVAYVMALRMGGAAPHLGLVLTKGSIDGYSVERDIAKMSNDRGDFLLHPSPMALAPGESYVLEWVLFWHQGKEDFYRRIKQYSNTYLHVTAEQFTVFEGENIHIEIEPNFGFEQEDVCVTRKERNIPFTVSDGKISIDEKADCIGERCYDILVKDIRTKCAVLVQPPLEKLAEQRCRFIARRQQYHKPGSHMDGAYLIYDNEEQHRFYTPKNDYNCARERIGMGLLITKYLQKHHDEFLASSLREYIAFVKRELADTETGEVFNDYMHDNSYFRLYNYPWYSLFFIELYTLYHNVEYLRYAERILRAFYEQGGDHFYAIEVPIVKIIACFEQENMTDEKETLLEWFKRHSDFIISQGTNYPAHEVNYEQSIVAPAANILIQAYQVTGEQKYWEGAKEQMKVLELFNGLQPDYHMYEVAIRHWDGYWFGKRMLYGDTYPHYWSSLTGNAYMDFGRITKNGAYMDKAEASWRGSLSLFLPDGAASCAFVYPISVNGRAAHGHDPYANDQDWGLYFMLRSRDSVIK